MIAKPLELAAVEENGQLRTRPGERSRALPQELIQTFDLCSGDFHWRRAVKEGELNVLWPSASDPREIPSRSGLEIAYELAGA
jgi:hypothetical protein